MPFVRDAGPEGPKSAERRLVTTGLIEPAESRWGLVPTRFAKQRYDAPVVDLEALRAEGSLASWATSRLVPKVLVATQGAVLEAVVDAEGVWLPSVPTLVCAPPPDRLWHVLAVLLAPPVVAFAAARYLGTGLSARSVKLSAKQLAALPLPEGRAAWDRGADLARRAQEAASEADRARLLAGVRRVDVRGVRRRPGGRAGLVDGPSRTAGRRLNRGLWLLDSGFVVGLSTSFPIRGTTSDDSTRTENTSRSPCPSTIMAAEHERRCPPWVRRPRGRFSC